MCARRRRFERMSEGETKKNPKRKRVKRLEKERKKERKTEEEEGRNSTETVQKQSMPIKCFVALQWKIFSFVLWKFSRRVEAASFSHSFISTLDQCALFGKHEKRWESKYLQLKCCFFYRQFVCKIFFYLNRWVFWDIFDAFLLFTFDMTGWLWFYYGHFCHAFHFKFHDSKLLCYSKKSDLFGSFQWVSSLWYIRYFEGSQRRWYAHPCDRFECTMHISFFNYLNKPPLSWSQHKNRTSKVDDTFRFN